MNETPTTTDMIDRLSAPAPALILGTAIWVLATIVVLLGGDRWADALPICYAGIGVGLLGYSLFRLQRRSARKGNRGAQQGAGLVD